MLHGALWGSFPNTIYCSFATLLDPTLQVRRVPSNRPIWKKKLIFLLYKIKVPIKEIVRRTKRGKSTTRHLLAVMSCHLMPNIKNILNSEGRRRHSRTAFSSYPSSTPTLHIDMWWYTNPYWSTPCSISSLLLPKSTRAVQRSYGLMRPACNLWHSIDCVWCFLRCNWYDLMYTINMVKHSSASIMI